MTFLVDMGAWGRPVETRILNRFRTHRNAVIAATARSPALAA